MDRAAGLLSKLDLIATLSLLGIAFVFGTLGGLGVSSAILYHQRKAYRMLSLGIGLGIAGGVMAMVFVSSLMVMDYLGIITIQDGGFIMFASFFSGSVAVIMLMLVKKITKMVFKYKGAEIDVLLKDGSVIEDVKGG